MLRSAHASAFSESVRINRSSVADTASKSPFCQRSGTMRARTLASSSEPARTTAKDGGTAEQDVAFLVAVKLHHAPSFRRSASTSASSGIEG